MSELWFSVSPKSHPDFDNSLFSAMFTNCFLSSLNFTWPLLWTFASFVYSLIVSMFTNILGSKGLNHLFLLRDANIYKQIKQHCLGGCLVVYC